MRAIVVGQPRDRERKSEREREKTVLKTTTIMVKKNYQKRLESILLQAKVFDLEQIRCQTIVRTQELVERKLNCAHTIALHNTQDKTFPLPTLPAKKAIENTTKSRGQKPPRNRLAKNENSNQKPILSS